jgi:hypothetical protein
MAATPHHSHASSGPLPVEPMPTPVTALRNMAGIAGVISLALLGIFFLIPSEHPAAFRGLLYAFHFWLGPTLGGMAFVMISHPTGGGWGVVFRRFGEAAFINLPLMLVVCLVLALGYSHLFPWAHMADYAGDGDAYGVMKSRLPWYSPGWFFVRQLAYFAIWGSLAFLLRTGSLKLDHAPNDRLRRRLRKISAAGIVLFFVTVTSYAMDYIMSRETNWFSSILGFVTAIQFGGSGVALCTLTVCYFAKRKPLAGVLSPQHLNDLGNLLLALTILWMYTSFAQLLIQWNGNMKDDIGYYVVRGMGTVPNGWRFVALALFLGHFLIPFFLLLMKGLKRKTATLGAICVWILIMRVVETCWVIIPPTTHHIGRSSDHGLPHLADLFAFVGVGGLWIYNYLRTLGTQPLLPQNATHQPEPISQGHRSTAHAI